MDKKNNNSEKNTNTETSINIEDKITKNEIDQLKIQLQKAQKEIQEKENILHDEFFNKILQKYNIKDELRRFVKLEPKNEKTADLEKVFEKYLKENPFLVKEVTTGGTETTINSIDLKKRENPLLKYKEENYL